MTVAKASLNNFVRRERILLTL